jgi:hypothetical protein
VGSWGSPYTQSCSAARVAMMHPCHARTLPWAAANVHGIRVVNLNQSECLRLCVGTVTAWQLAEMVHDISVKNLILTHEQLINTTSGDRLVHSGLSLWDTLIEWLRGGVRSA